MVRVQEVRPFTPMKYDWLVETATLAVPQPTYEPSQLPDVLNRLERAGWEIFSVIPDQGREGFNRVRVVARRPLGRRVTPRISHSS